VQTTKAPTAPFLFSSKEPKMIEPISYRRATIDDILTVCELGQILNTLHHQARPDIYASATAEFARDKPHWLSSLQGEDRAMFLAEHGVVAVGFVTVQLMQPISPLLQPLIVGRIGSIAVSERLRGRGVATALMKLAEEWARTNGAHDMRLSVRAFNQQAIDLYNDLGYELRAFEMGKQFPVAEDVLFA
jgi:ribosomal protein S18 acetylase RimI-like enzyme